MTARRNIYIIDDEAVVRASIISLVQAGRDVQARCDVICHEYRNGDAFLEALDALEPGCVVLDLQLEAANGAEVMHALTGRPGFRTIVVTGFGDLAVATEAFRAGAVDFLYKPYEMQRLLDAFHRAFHQLDHGADRPEMVAEAQARLARLGLVETDILARLVRGQTNQDIAEALSLDPRTVQIHRARALAVLDAPSILAAIRTMSIAGWQG